MRTTLIVLTLIFCATLAGAEVPGMTKLNSVRLYLPDAPLKERIGNDAGPLAEYVKALQHEADAFWGAADRPEAKGLLVAFGVRPDGKSKVWCDAVDGDVPAKTLEKFTAALEKVKPVQVKNAPIAFAIELGLAGRMPAEFPVLPKAWSEAAKNAKQPLQIPDGLFKVIWLD